MIQEKKMQAKKRMAFLKNSYLQVPAKPLADFSGGLFKDETSGN